MDEEESNLQTSMVSHMLSTIQVDPDQPARGGYGNHVEKVTTSSEEVEVTSGPNILIIIMQLKLI